jgi:hypothetical protein
MIPKSGYRFSDKIMPQITRLKRNADSTKNHFALSGAYRKQQTREETMTLAAAPEAATGDPLFAGLFDRSITSIPASIAKQRYLTSIAPVAANPGRWIEQPRLPIPVGEHAVIECMAKIHVIAG